jgi:hypothetical protein
MSGALGLQFNKVLKAKSPHPKYQKTQKRPNLSTIIAWFDRHNKDKRDLEIIAVLEEDHFKYK